MKNNCSVEKVAELLLAQDNISLLCHRHPDGDTVGSAFALYYALESLGKEVRVLCADPLPKQFSYLYGDYKPGNILRWPLEYVVSVDVATTELLGGLEEKYGSMVDLCIDHHPTNSDYAALSIVHGECAATAELMAAILDAMGVLIEGKIAQCLYTGLVTDTGCFRFSNTTRETLLLGARLKGTGIDTPFIHTVIFESKTRALITLEAKLLSAIEYYGNGRIAVMPVPLVLREETGVTQEELDEVCSIPRKIEGVLIGITVKEQVGECRISIRTKEEADASQIAACFGGGGHRQASGCTIKATMKEAIRLLVEKAQESLLEDD